MIMEREQILRQFEFRKRHRRTVEVWLRADLKCEYCGKNLAEIVADYYHGSHVDHVVPNKDDSIENLALACIACNRIKRHRRFGEGLIGLSRTELVKLAADYVETVRARDRERLTDDITLFSLLRTTDLVNIQND